MHLHTRHRCSFKPELVVHTSNVTFWIGDFYVIINTPASALIIQLLAQGKFAFYFF